MKIDKKRPWIPIVVAVWMIIWLISGCGVEKRPPEKPGPPLVQLPKDEYPNFSDDLPYETLAAAVRQSLAYLAKLPPERQLKFGRDEFTAGHVTHSLETFLQFIATAPDARQLKRFIAERYRVYASVGRTPEREVLFTGYYEPLLNGSLLRQGLYQYPLYQRPDDLVTVNLALFSPKFKGERIVGRYTGQSVVPYYDRREIENGATPGDKLSPLAWVEDPVELFFLHVQGSGRIKLQEGGEIAVHYHGANGHPYRSIGKLLIDEGKISREEMSLQAIRSYLKANPDEIEKTLNYNPSYVFFKIEEDGPLGNLGQPLTPERSIATDYRLFPKASLAFIEAQKPIVDGNGEIERWVPLSRFVLNQDTGGAIRGPGRVDLFWGGGSYAEVAAGHLKHPGRLYFLVLEPGRST